jgi:hypothetical protein
MSVIRCANGSDGSWFRLPAGEAPVSAHEYFMPNRPCPVAVRPRIRAIRSAWRAVIGGRIASPTITMLRAGNQDGDGVIRHGDTRHVALPANRCLS